MQAIAGFFASLYGAAILAGCIIVFGLYQYWFRFRNRLDPIGKELIQANVDRLHLVRHFLSEQ